MKLQKRKPVCFDGEAFQLQPAYLLGETYNTIPVSGLSCVGKLNMVE